MFGHILLLFRSTNGVDKGGKKGGTGRKMIAQHASVIVTNVFLLKVKFIVKYRIPRTNAALFISLPSRICV